MFIAGCCSVGLSERGALGFSNEKSLMYWPSTLSCGCAVWAFGACASPPFPGIRHPRCCSARLANMAPALEQARLPLASALLAARLGSSMVVLRQPPLLCGARLWIA